MVGSCKGCWIETYNLIPVPLCTGAHVYGYDAIYQLTSATIPTLPQEAYSYDKVGNRKTSAQTEGPWSYNKNNELLSYNGTVLTYDANGNTVTKSENGATTTYNYGATDRLTSVQLPDGRIATYKYDPFGRRVSKQVGTQASYFLYADEGLIGEYGANGSFSKGYGWRPNGIWGTDPVFMVENGKYYFYHNDHLGTPQKITDAAGSVKWSATYSVFGDATVDAGSTVVNNLQFPGQYWDEESRLYYNWNRYYDTSTGKYLGQDQLGGEYNLYVYSANNPLRLFDSMGLLTQNKYIRSNLPKFTNIASATRNVKYTCPYNEVCLSKCLGDVFVNAMLDFASGGLNPLEVHIFQREKGIIDVTLISSMGPVIEKTNNYAESEIKSAEKTMERIKKASGKHRKASTLAKYAKEVTEISGRMPILKAIPVVATAFTIFKNGSDVINCLDECKK